jgi:hypothetical protein
MCIVHAGFRGFRAFAARKKSRYKIDRKSLRNPARHHTLNVGQHAKEMTANYKILCDIGDNPNFLIGGQGKPVDFSEIEKSENLNRIYRFQFKQPPKNGQLEKVISAIKKRPEIELRFYGNYSEELIDWGSLTEIQNLQIDLWETIDLREISSLRNLKRLGITTLWCI